MERVIVVGTTGSGKTTLARQIAQAIDAPHVELDAVYWGPNWSERPREEFREAVREHVKSDRWVVDGNYSKARDILLARATDAVWLNYSFPVVFGRALLRTCRRVFLREELFGGNRETFKGAVLSRDSILLWVIKTFRGRRVEYNELFGTGAGARLSVTELRHPREADELLRRIGSAGRAA